MTELASFIIVFCVMVNLAAVVALAIRVERLERAAPKKPRVSTKIWGL